MLEFSKIKRFTKFDAWVAKTLVGIYLLYEMRGFVNRYRCMFFRDAESLQRNDGAILAEVNLFEPAKAVCQDHFDNFCEEQNERNCNQT